MFLTQLVTRIGYSVTILVGLMEPLGSISTKYSVPLERYEPTSLGHLHY